MIARAPFGSTGHHSTRTIFGGASLGQVSHADAGRTLEPFLQHGGDHVDVAASYGDAELRVASWLKRDPDTFAAAETFGQRPDDAAMDASSSAARWHRC